jgi:hypothetical protein
MADIKLRDKRTAACTQLSYTAIIYAPSNENTEAPGRYKI